MPDASLPEELLSAWMDGQLTGPEKARAEAMIADNPQYADLIRQWKTQRDQIRSLPRFRLDEDFSNRVLTKSDLSATDTIPLAETANRPAETTSYVRSAVAAILSLAAMLLLTLFVFPNQFEVADSVAHNVSGPEAAEPSKAKESGVTELAGELEEESAPRQSVESLVAGQEQLQLKSDDAVDVDDTSRSEQVANQSIRRRAMEKSPLLAKKETSKLGKGGLDAAVDSRQSKSRSGLDPSIVTRGIAGKAEGFAGQKGANFAQDEAKELAAIDQPGFPNRELKFPTPSAPPVFGAFRGNDKQQKVGELADSNQNPIAVEDFVANGNDAFSQVWVIEINEEPSLKKIESAFQRNQISFQQMLVANQPEGARDRFVDPQSRFQVVDVMTSQQQMLGALKMLADNAVVTEFPISPEFSAAKLSKLVENPNSPELENDVSPTDTQPALRSNESGIGIPRSLAQTLPSKPRSADQLDAVAANRTVDQTPHPLAQRASEAAIQKPDAIAGKQSSDAKQPRGDENNKEWFDVQGEKDQQEFAQAGETTDGNQLQAQRQQLHRYLLLIRFDSSLDSQAIPGNALPSKSPR